MSIHMSTQPTCAMDGIEVKPSNFGSSARNSSPADSRHTATKAGRHQGTS